MEGLKNEGHGRSSHPKCRVCRRPGRSPESSTAAPPYCADRTVPELDPVLLRRTVEDADIRVLLMVVFHLSGTSSGSAQLSPAARRPADRQ
jgi:hypothetical protein